MERMDLLAELFLCLECLIARLGIVPDTSIYTENGIKKMEDIACGDKLDGSFNRY